MCSVGRILMRLAPVFVLSVSLLAQSGESNKPSEPAANRNNLSPMAWMVGDWNSQVTPPGAQKPIQIDQHIASILGGKAFRFTTFFDGVQQYEGLFAYNAANKSINFWYPSASGEITSGAVSSQSDSLVLDFNVTSANGQVTPFQVHIRPLSPEEYEWTLFQQNGTAWEQMFSLHYHRARG